MEVMPKDGHKPTNGGFDEKEEFGIKVRVVILSSQTLKRLHRRVDQTYYLYEQVLELKVNVFETLIPLNSVYMLFYLIYAKSY